MVHSKQHAFCYFCELEFCEVFCNYCKFKPKAEIKANKPNGSRMGWDHTWDYTRKLVLLRDKNSCVRCHRMKPKGLEVHHLIRKEMGGSDHPHNLISLCVDCHKHTFSDRINKLIEKREEIQNNDRYWKNLIQRESEANKHSP